MRFQPVCAPSAVGYEGYGEGCGALHLLYHYALHLFFLLHGYGEVEFVVHLEYHLCVQSLSFEAVVYAYHRHLHYVCRGALYGSVDGVALGEGTHGGVARG